MILAVAGFAAALTGVLRDDRRVVWVAIGLVGAAFVLRLVSARLARTEMR